MTIPRHTIPAGQALLLAGLAVGLTAPSSARSQDAGEKPRRPQPTMEQRLAAAESVFDGLDKNRDGKLRGDEIGNAAWLERYDRDADNVITRAEMLAVVRRGPGLDHLLVLRDPRARVRNALRQFDQDKDGTVAADEYPGNARLFRKMDRNRDGKLEWKELARLAEHELEDIRKRAKSPGRYEFLNLFDLNYDRQVTKNEYDGPSRSFRKYDENGDGVVDYYEIYPTRRPAEMENSGPKPQDLSVIATLDANDDGRVARDEFKGSEAAWKRLDRNGDGWITAADAR